MVTNKTKITHDIMLDHGFIQTDWFYELENGFTVGFLFWNSMLVLKKEEDRVDIFYKETKLYKIPLTYMEDLKYLYTLITKEELKKNGS